MTPDFSSQPYIQSPTSGAPLDLKLEQISGREQSSEIVISQENLDKIDLSKLKDFQFVLIERDSFNLDKILAKTVELNLGKSKSVTIRIDNSEAEIKKILSSFRFESPEAFELFAQDLAWQTKIFGAIQSIKKTRISIDFVLPIKYPPKNPLEGFHVDATPCRCLCTFVGPGTEWVKENSLNNEIKNSLSTNQKAKLLDKMNWLLPNSEIQRIPTGAVAIAKANEWIHRRPWTKQGRIFVSMDPT